jgi:hypothetical protein
MDGRAIKQSGPRGREPQAGGMPQPPFPTRYIILPLQRIRDKGADKHAGAAEIHGSASSVPTGLGRTPGGAQHPRVFQFWIPARRAPAF